MVFTDLRLLANMKTGYLLLTAAVVVLVWFLAGVIYSYSRGQRLLHWLASGLATEAAHARLRWLATTVAEMVIEGGGPWERLVVLLTLAPRDAPWLWLWAALRGRGDVLVLRCPLASPPPVVIELLDPAACTARETLSQVLREGWEAAPPLDANPALLTHGRVLRQLVLMAPQGRVSAAVAALPRYLNLLERMTPRLLRFSVRRDPPMIEVHLPPPNYTADLSSFWDAVRELIA